MASTSMAEVSHPVVFTTQSAYPFPSQKFMIPASWRRYQLSQLVNKALSLDKPVPFDFLVRGEILRTTLAEWCAEKGIGEEETLEIEYFESVMPPQKMSSLPHEDWVSSVSCSLPGHFLTASYDGHIRLFDYSQNLLHSISVHSAPCTSLALIPDPNARLVASASHDLTASITQLPSPSSPTTQPQTLATLHLHTAPLASIAASPSGTHLLTASWDTLIGVWDTQIPPSDEVPLDDSTNTNSDRKKRRKLDGGDSDARPKRKAPLTVLKSHTARVSKALFAREAGESDNAAPRTAYSAGFDSTVRTWDVENGICTHTITASSKPFLDLVPTPTGTSLLASSTDRTVSQYDTRLAASSSTTTPSIATLHHPSTPSCIAVPSPSPPLSLSASPYSQPNSPPNSTPEHQLITGAYDGVVRLWDLRSVKSAVTSFKAWENPGNKKGRKVLSVDWAGGVVGIAGEGGVEVWRVGQDGR